MDRLALRSVNFGTVAAVLACSGVVLAQEAPPAPAPVEAAAPAPAPGPEAAAPEPAAPAAALSIGADAPAPEPAAAKPKPPPYSLPWQLRPAVVGNVVRSDTAFAFYKDPGVKKSGYSVTSMLLFSYKVTDNIAPLVRIGVSGNAPPLGVNNAGGKDIDRAQNFLNPVLGGTYAIKPAKDLRLAFFLGLTLPIGGGSGDKPDPSNAAVNNPYGIRSRSAMDNAMFLVNDFAIFPGVDFAYVAKGLTVQAEATLFQLTRVKGDAQPAMGNPVNPDKSKTNLTMGLHVGYFIIPQLSIGAELRHQRFLSTPVAVEKDEAAGNKNPQGLRDTTTWAIGPRGHFKLSDSVWFRPGVSFSMPVDDPMKKSEYKVVQLDLPVAF